MEDLRRLPVLIRGRRDGVSLRLEDKGDADKDADDGAYRGGQLWEPKKFGLASRLTSQIGQPLTNWATSSFGTQE
jgi:hypothetical protein